MAAVRPQRARAPGEQPTRTGKVKFYQDRRGEWRWRLLTANNRTVSDSAEGYTRKHGAERAWARVRTLIAELPA